jgi:UDP-glucose 4-epimerase
VVAIFSYQLWRGESPTLFGNGTPTRDYVHVSDVVAAMLAARGKPGVFNIASGTETSVLTIFEGLRTAARATVEPKLASLRPGELERSCMNPEHARRELGWRTEIELTTGLADTYRQLVEEFEDQA